MPIQMIILLALAGVFLLLALAALFFRRTVATTIDGFSWKRIVFLEHYVWVEETSYQGFPEGSRNQRTTTERYMQYQQTGMQTQTTVTNGVTTTTNVPVYGFVPHTRTKYTYEVQRWVPSCELEASGNTRITYWPPYKLNSTTSERVAETEEHYVVRFRSAKGHIYQRELPEPEWLALDKKATYTLKVTIFGRITDILPGTEAEQVVAAQKPD
jgi:hypothetical protein